MQPLLDYNARLIRPLSILAVNGAPSWSRTTRRAARQLSRQPIYSRSTGERGIGSGGRLRSGVLLGMGQAC